MKFPGKAKVPTSALRPAPLVITPHQLGAKVPTAILDPALTLPLTLPSPTPKPNLTLPLTYP